MTPFRFAALVSALFTVTLNAHHGFKSTPVLEYAVLFATLNGALDIAKCSCLVGMHQAAQHGRYLASLLLFLIFWPLFANSLWCGLSEITIARTGKQNQYHHAQDLRARLKAQFGDLRRERNTLQSHQMYTWSSSCVRPRNRSQRRYCKRIDLVKTKMEELRAQLDTPAPPDPTPHVTMVRSLTGYSQSEILFALALWPILLAELVGSLGFYLTAASTRKTLTAPLRAPTTKRDLASFQNTRSVRSPKQSNSVTAKQSHVRWNVQR